MAVTDPVSKIWITSKTRIHSERRFNHYSIVSHLALSWYAFLTIVFSIYQKSFEQTLGVDETSKVSLVMSVLTFGLSLIIYGFKFDESARTHRECYLAMQAILNSDDTVPNKMARYSSVLDRFPNHADRDYQEFLFTSWREGETVTGSNGEVKKFDRLSLAKSYLRHGAWYSFLALVFVLPVVCGALWLKPTAIERHHNAGVGAARPSGIEDR